MGKQWVRYACVGALCVACGVAGYWAGMRPATADAAIDAAAMIPAAVQSQAAAGNGAYTVLPVLDGGSGYTWMAYAIAVSPQGKVSIFKAHPKEESELGTIVKQFSIQ